LGAGILIGQMLFKPKSSTAVEVGTATPQKMTSKKDLSKRDLSQNKHEGYQAYLKPPIGLKKPMIISGDEAFMDGMRQYRMKQYTNARDMWEKLPHGSLTPDSLDFFIGGTYFAQEDYQKAIFHFQKAKTRPGTEFFDRAGWFLAVSHAKLRNTYLAIEYLKPIQHPLKDQFLNELYSILPKEERPKMRSSKKG